MIKLQSWKVSDAFWERAEKLLPKPKRDKTKKYKRKEWWWRKPINYRTVFEWIVYVLRTWIQWKAIPKDIFGAASSIHEYFTSWAKDWFFLRLWKAWLQEYDELEWIAWKWQSADWAMTKSPLGLEKVGKNPTDRGKKLNKKKFISRRIWSPSINSRKRS